MKITLNINSELLMKTTQKRLLKQRMCIASRTIACVSFLLLTILGISSLVGAMSLETIDNEDGVPASWQAASLGEPSTITLPITYWDQKADSCDDPNRQFEWTLCSGYRTHGVLTGIVKSRLGSDRLPIPAFSDTESSWKALHDALSINVIGHDPVLKTDNFYRWFHEVPGLSKRIDGRTVTFNRTAERTYTYGGQDIYPIDDVPGIDASDIKLNDWQGQKHNFGFTAHLGFAIKVAASGSERFEFSGDDDVWVFLNNKLVLDIGGLHGPISGWFQINNDGTVDTFIEKVNNLDIRNGDWVECMRIKDLVYADQSCINAYNVKIRENFKTTSAQHLDFGLNPGDVVSLDFFYAERSTDGSNTKITIDHMNWPISADSDITAEVVGKINGTENKLVEFNTYVKNRDPENPLDLERIAAYIREATNDGVNEGYLPLDETTLFYTTTPDDDNSWRPVKVSAPDNSDDGFNLSTPIRMAPAGEDGDTLYFRYYGETSDHSGTMSSTISYYTTLTGNAGVTYDHDEVSYVVDPESPDLPDPDTPNPDVPDPDTPEVPDLPETPDPESPETPDIPGNSENPETPDIPSLPNTDLTDDGLIYLPPLGEIAFVPNTGIVRTAVSGFLGDDFAEVILSQASILAVLFVFAGSFAIYFRTRKALTSTASARTTVRSSKSAKSISNIPSTRSSKKSSQKSVKVAAAKSVSRKKLKPATTATSKKTTKSKSSKPVAAAKIKRATKSSKKS